MSTIDQFATQVGADMKALRYDSGVRNVSALLSNGWGGTVYLWREGRAVTMQLEALTAGSSTAVLTLPSGFVPRPVGAGTRHRGVVTTAPGTVRRTAFTGGTLSIFNAPAGETLYGTLHFTTTDQAPVPGTEPGTAA